MERCEKKNAVWDVNELVRQLRFEKLFISSEQQQIQSLNEKIIDNAEKLSQSAWINAQQRINLNKLIVARPDCSPAKCCQRAKSLDSTNFVDAKKLLQYPEVVGYGEFLRALRASPEQLAHWLVVGERSVEGGKLLVSVVQSLIAGLYGSLILSEDAHLVLRLLRHLAHLQLTTSENPRRLLRRGSCAFSRLYSVYHEGLFAAKLFLTAALQCPIMYLIANSNCYVDIDPDKTLLRLSQSERIEKFGHENSPEYSMRIQQHRKWVVDTLIDLTSRFIYSLQQNMFCFPVTLTWLVRQIALSLSKSCSLKSKEVNAMCTDLVFTYFICPAIVHPEPYGICDAPISDIARHNLMQVGRILQMLALVKYEKPEQKLTDLYCGFEHGVVANVLDHLLQDTDTGDRLPSLCELPGIRRTTALFTDNELQNLVSFLQATHNCLCQDQSVNEQASQSSSCSSSDIGISGSREQLSMLLSALPASREGSPQNKRIINGISPDTPTKKTTLLGKVSKSKLNNSKSAAAATSNATTEHNDEHSNDHRTENSVVTVLVIPLHLGDSDSVGLLSEQKVLNMGVINVLANNLDKITLSDTVDNIEDCPESDRIPDSAILTLNSGQEKRTRFSLSHDEGSIGNTSDNLEAISEAASNHSVASSLELENEDQNDNDNLSDMVSANVSGRGTPNISGRDTPSSQVTEGEEGRQNMEIRQAFLPPPQPLITKQIRSEIDDKFCKFEIKKLLEGDETISIISDTWSTDVLASDSETIEAGENRNLVPPAPPILEPPLLPPLLDVSETQSESAWSTDVLASDSERMTEVDTDDTASVARSDDTARSEVEETPPSIHLLHSLATERQNIEVGVNPPYNGSRNLIILGPVDNNPMPHSFGSYNFNGYSVRENVPNSPIRNELNPSSANVTGQGGRKSDYQRRTVEYVDNNANAVSVFCETSHVTVSQSQNETIVERSVIRSSSSRSNSDPSRRERIVIDDKNFSISFNGGGKSAELLETAQAGPSGINRIGNKENQTYAPQGGGNHIGMAAVQPAYLLVNHVGPAKYSKKLSNSDIRLSNVSLNSTSSGSSSSSEAQSKNASSETPNGSAQWNINDSERSLNITSTPTGSTSEMSVLSPNTLISPINNMSFLKGKPNNLNQSSLKPSISTGAIPKSISFDMSAEKGDKDLLDDDNKKRSGFFGKLKMGFRNRRGKSLRGLDDFSEDQSPRLRRFNIDESAPQNTIPINNETSEDILAKYRRKPSLITTDGSTTNSGISIVNKLKRNDMEDERFTIDYSNLEQCFAFADAKRKLRHVFSNADLLIVPRGYRVCWHQSENDLISYLQLQLAKARNQKEWSNVARIAEALRCIQLFDASGCRKLYDSLRDDYCKRHVYTKYLLQCRQLLLSTVAHLDGLEKQIEGERDASANYLVAVCVRLFLERREEDVLRFCDEFQQLTLADEKNYHLDTFLMDLVAHVERDPMFQAASESQLEQAQIAIERSVMSQVYLHALYPNGDGDRDRDRVLLEHIKKLSFVVTPNHKSLQIHKAFQYECPWPSAQEALTAMAAFRTPRDKLMCVLNCCSAIMDLLALAHERGAPTADDFTPVLVYVIIKTNPQDLLSTIQYVTSFYANRLVGEEQYWWTQFCSAVEFIKTMDYLD